MIKKGVRMGSLQLILMQKKDHLCQQDAIVKALTHKDFLRPNAIATVRLIHCHHLCEMSKMSKSPLSIPLLGCKEGLNAANYRVFRRHILF
jgi:hypothetical protein